MLMWQQGIQYLRHQRPLIASASQDTLNQRRELINQCTQSRAYDCHYKWIRIACESSDKFINNVCAHAPPTWLNASTSGWSITKKQFPRRIQPSETNINPKCLETWLFLAPQDDPVFDELSVGLASLRLSRAHLTISTNPGEVKKRRWTRFRCSLLENNARTHAHVFYRLTIHHVLPFGRSSRTLVWRVPSLPRLGASRLITGTN